MFHIPVYIKATNAFATLCCKYLSSVYSLDTLNPLYCIKTETDGSEYWWACDGSGPITRMYLMAVHVRSSNKRQMAPAMDVRERQLAGIAGVRTPLKS